jgi:two-component system phosphate regulon sensor histidine kinase PhoR
VLAESNGLSVHLDIDPGTPPVFADRVQLERLITNLLTNAIKYTPAGGRIDIRVGGRSSVQIEVQDTGRGIPEDALPHIFDRFYRVPGTATNEGLGLGLSFVSWIAKAHGGQVGVTSRLGEGTTFRVTLPAPHGQRTVKMEAYGVSN